MSTQRTSQDLFDDAVSDEELASIGHIGDIDANPEQLQEVAAHLRSLVGSQAGVSIQGDAKGHYSLSGLVSLVDETPGNETVELAPAVVGNTIVKSTVIMLQEITGLQGLRAPEYRPSDLIRLDLAEKALTKSAPATSTQVKQPLCSTGRPCMGGCGTQMYQSGSANQIERYCAGCYPALPPSKSRPITPAKQGLGSEGVVLSGRNTDTEVSSTQVLGEHNSKLYPSLSQLEREVSASSPWRQPTSRPTTPAERRQRSPSTLSRPVTPGANQSRPPTPGCSKSRPTTPKAVLSRAPTPGPSTSRAGTPAPSPAKKPKVPQPCGSGLGDAFMTHRAVDRSSDTSLLDGFQPVAPTLKETKDNFIKEAIFLLRKYETKYLDKPDKIPPQTSTLYAAFWNAGVWVEKSIISDLLASQNDLKSTDVTALNLLWSLAISNPSTKFSDISEERSLTTNFTEVPATDFSLTDKTPTKSDTDEGVGTDDAALDGANGDTPLGTPGAHPIVPVHLASPGLVDELFLKRLWRHSFADGSKLTELDYVSWLNFTGVAAYMATNDLQMATPKMVLQSDRSERTTRLLTTWSKTFANHQLPFGQWSDLFGHKLPPQKPSVPADLTSGDSASSSEEELVDAEEAEKVGISIMSNTGTPLLTINSHYNLVAKLMGRATADALHEHLFTAHMKTAPKVATDGTFSCPEGLTNAQLFAAVYYRLGKIRSLVFIKPCYNLPIGSRHFADKQRIPTNEREILTYLQNKATASLIVKPAKVSPPTTLPQTSHTYEKQSNEIRLLTEEWKQSGSTDSLKTYIAKRNTEIPDWSNGPTPLASELHRHELSDVGSLTSAWMAQGSKQPLVDFLRANYRKLDPSADTDDSILAMFSSMDLHNNLKSLVEQSDEEEHWSTAFKRYMIRLPPRTHAHLEEERIIMANLRAEVPQQVLEDIKPDHFLPGGKWVHQFIPRYHYIPKGILEGLQFHCDRSSAQYMVVWRYLYMARMQAINHFQDDLPGYPVMCNAPWVTLQMDTAVTKTFQTWDLDIVQYNEAWLLNNDKGIHLLTCREVYDRFFRPMECLLAVNMPLSERLRQALSSKDKTDDLAKILIRLAGMPELPLGMGPKFLVEELSKIRALTLQEFACCEETDPPACILARVELVPSPVRLYEESRREPLERLGLKTITKPYTSIYKEDYDRHYIELGQNLLENYDSLEVLSTELTQVLTTLQSSGDPALLAESRTTKNRLEDRIDMINKSNVSMWTEYDEVGLRRTGSTYIAGIERKDQKVMDGLFQKTPDQIISVIKSWESEVRQKREEKSSVEACLKILTRGKRNGTLTRNDIQTRFIMTENRNALDYKIWQLQQKIAHAAVQCEYKSQVVELHLDWATEVEEEEARVSREEARSPTKPDLGSQQIQSIWEKPIGTKPTNLTVPRSIQWQRDIRDEPQGSNPSKDFDRSRHRSASSHRFSPSDSSNSSPSTRRRDKSAHGQRSEMWQDSRHRSNSKRRQQPQPRQTQSSAIRTDLLRQWNGKRLAEAPRWATQALSINNVHLTGATFTPKGFLMVMPENRLNHSVKVHGVNYRSTMDIYVHQAADARPLEIWMTETSTDRDTECRLEGRIEVGWELVSPLSQVLTQLADHTFHPLTEDQTKAYQVLFTNKLSVKHRSVLIQVISHIGRTGQERMVQFTATLNHMSDIVRFPWVHLPRFNSHFGAAIRAAEDVRPPARHHSHGRPA